jgi:hypothetical protein
VRPVKGSKLFVCLYRGVIFSRKTTFVWQEVKNDEAAPGETPAQDDGKPKFDFKMKIEPALNVFSPCGSLVPYPDFPIFVFASEGNVIYSDASMKTFKKFGELPASEFYSKIGEGAAQSFDLPDIDKSVYEGTSEELDETKRGLLTPIFMISVEKEPNGSLSIAEILDIRASDTFTFAEKAAEETPGEGDEDPCERDGEDPADGRTTVGGDPNLGDVEPTEDVVEEEQAVDPCPEDV